MNNNKAPKVSPIKSVNLKQASIFKSTRPANWSIKTPTQRKAKGSSWLWSNEY